LAPWAIFCNALPAVTALRLAHPGWVIDWVVEPRWRALLAPEPAIEKLARAVGPTLARTSMQQNQHRL